MRNSAEIAKEVTDLAKTYRERQEALDAQHKDVQRFLSVPDNAKHAAAVSKFQTDYLAFLKTGNLMEGHPTFPLTPSNEAELNPLADALKRWQDNAYKLNSTREDMVKAAGNAKASDAILAQLDRNEFPLPPVTSILMKHTPLFEITNPPTKEEAIAAVVAAEKDAAKHPAIKDKYAKAASSTEILMDFATDGKMKAAPTQDGAQLDAAQAKKLGAALLHIEKARENPSGKQLKRPEAVLVGADGKPYTLEAKELSAYLQTAKPSGTVQEPVDTWAKRQGVALNNHGKEYTNVRLSDYGEDFYIETPEGQRRTVSNGIITEPLKGGHYGAIKGLKVGDGDDLDVYISTSVMKDMVAGKKYEGKIQVMQQMTGGKPDELKIGFTESREEFRKIQASTWKPATGFAQRNEGAYVELTQEQFRVMKRDIDKNPNLTLAEFVKLHPDMNLTVTEKKDLPYVRSVDGPKAEEVTAQKDAFKTLQLNLYAATDGIGTDAQRAVAKASQPALIDAAKKAYIAGTLGATDADAAKAVNAFVTDITGKTKASIAADKVLYEAAFAGKTGNAIATLRKNAIDARQAALGENETLADTTKLTDAHIKLGADAKVAADKAAAEAAAQAAAIAEEARKAAVVVQERSIKVVGGLSQTIKKEKEVIATIKAAMIEAGITNATDKDAALTVALMVASENKLPNANKIKDGTALDFLFTKGEIEAAMTKLKAATNNGEKHVADLYKPGQTLEPTAIVGQLVREPKLR